MSFLKKTWPVMVATAISMLGASVASAKPIKTWETYGWTMGAYSNDQTGAFSHCATSIPYKSGVSLYFSVDAQYLWQMGFSHQQWQLNAGERFPLRYNIDSGGQINATGVAVNEQLVVVELPDSKELFEVFRAGRRLYVYAAGQSFSFNLDNTRSVLNELLNCTKTFAVNNNPFSPGGGGGGGGGRGNNPTNPWSGTGGGGGGGGGGTGGGTGSPNPWTNKPKGGQGA